MSLQPYYTVLSDLSNVFWYVILVMVILMTIQIGSQILKVKACTNFFSRCLGMMGKKKPLSYGFYFPKCKSIHTFFMRQNIDIIMVNQKKQIVAFYQNAKPWRIFYSKKAYACYEFSTGILNEVIIGKSVILK